MLEMILIRISRVFEGLLLHGDSMSGDPCHLSQDVVRKINWRAFYFIKLLQLHKSNPCMLIGLADVEWVDARERERERERERQSVGREFNCMGP